jgi:hypothetical protein
VTSKLLVTLWLPMFETNTVTLTVCPSISEPDTLIWLTAISVIEYDGDGPEALIVARLVVAERVPGRDVIARRGGVHGNECG